MVVVDVAVGKIARVVVGRTEAGGRGAGGGRKDHIVCGDGAGRRDIIAVVDGDAAALKYIAGGAVRTRHPVIAGAQRAQGDGRRQPCRIRAVCAS